MMTAQLSKSKFVGGCQCLRRLWLECYRPELAAPIDLATQALFDAGAEVGAFARECFPGGVLVDEPYYEHDAAVARTAQLTGDTSLSALFEAAFVHEDIRIRVDVLERYPGDKCRVVEVKQSASVKEEHLLDLAIQHYVLAGCGVKLAADALMHINSDYVFDGKELALDELLVVDDATQVVADRLTDLPDLLAAQRAVLARPEEPTIDPGFHCGDPWECPFMEHCTSDKPKYWVRYLPGMSRRRLSELAEMGIEEIADIPDDYPLSEQQTRAREVTRTGEPRLCADPAGELTSIHYPIQFLDFETVSPAIPRYAGTRPYDIVPFQWSLHTLDANGSVSYDAYLCEEDRDPRSELAGALLKALDPKGTVLAYSAGFEKRVLGGLAAALPSLAGELTALASRIEDLLVLVKQCYYHRAFLGSYSLKRVLPVMAPDAAYDDLEIQDGSIASVQYLNMLSETNTEARRKIRADLLAYSERDTWAMVRIWEELGKLAQRPR